MSVVLTFLGLFKKYVPNDGAWKGAVILSFLMSLFDGLNVAQASGLFPWDISPIMDVVYQIPLARQGFAWLIPTLIGFVAGTVIYKVNGKKSLSYEV